MKAKNRTVRAGSARITLEYPASKLSKHEAKIIELFPLDLRFPEFVEQFTRFGAARWYFAYLDKKAGKEMNIDLREELARSLAPYRESGAYTSEIEGLLARARR